MRLFVLLLLLLSTTLGGCSDTDQTPRQTRETTHFEEDRHVDVIQYPISKDAIALIDIIESSPVLVVIHLARSAKTGGAKLISEIVNNEPFESPEVFSYIESVEVVHKGQSRLISVGKHAIFPHVDRGVLTTKEEMNAVSSGKLDSFIERWSITGAPNGRMILTFLAGDGAATYVGGLEIESNRLLAVGFRYVQEDYTPRMLATEKARGDAPSWKEL